MDLIKKPIRSEQSGKILLQIGVSEQDCTIHPVRADRSVIEGFFMGDPGVLTGVYAPDSTSLLIGVRAHRDPSKTDDSAVIEFKVTEFSDPVS